MIQSGNELHSRRTTIRLIGGTIITLLLIIGLGARGHVAGQGTSTAEGTLAATVDKKATLAKMLTPLAARFEIRRGKPVNVTSIELRRVGLGPIAIDGNGLIYVGDGGQNVHIFSSEMIELRQFELIQPFGVLLTQRNELLIGQRNQINLRLYGRDGRFIRTFWEQPNGFMDTFAISPNGTVYIAWQSISLPRVAYLTHLDATGNVLYTKEMGRPEENTDAIHALLIDRDGAVYMALSGFGRSEKGFLEVVILDSEGDPMRKRPAFFRDDQFYPPAALTSLNDASLVMFSLGSVGWWLPNGDMNALLSTLYIREGFPLSTTAHTMAVATRPDGRSVVIAEALSDGTLQMHIMDFVDHEQPIPTSTSTSIPTPTPSPSPTATPS